LNHPDLTVDVSRSRTFLGGTSTPDDQNGHGTHVAGTIAAIDNTIGVVGVAAGATVVAVRVLDRRGSGTTSGVIAGVNYVASVGVSGDVANMSLGGSVSKSLDDAVLAASAKVKFTLAAGNETDNANNHSPARVNGTNVYTVSAMDKVDKFAYFSNYGNPPVDYCAPGVSIYSTYKDGGYATLSGTSMAAPHVAGILALGNLRSDSYVLSDPDGNADPIAEH
jgi:subtilisin family serine protease